MLFFEVLKFKIYIYFKFCCLNILVKYYSNFCFKKNTNFNKKLQN